jgi:hypothetical protein
MSSTPEIRDFLDSFHPTLVHLLSAFQRAKFYDDRQLWLISTWPRHRITSFFSAMHGPPGTSDTLAPEVVEALATRLYDNRCICGECPNVLPPQRTCRTYSSRLLFSTR